MSSTNALKVHVQPSAQLGIIVGNAPLSRADITKRVWEYIKSHGLQDTRNKRMINADDNLRQIFGCDQVSMFEMSAMVSKHVSKIDAATERY